MAIISALPYNIVNGQVEDATQVMANFNQIVSQVNAGVAAKGTNSDITALNALGNINSFVNFNAGLNVASGNLNVALGTISGIGTGLTGTAAGLTVGNATNATNATTATSATTATNLAGGLDGYIPYQSAANTTSFVSSLNSGYFFVSNAGVAPQWSNPTGLTVGGLSGASPALGTNWQIDANGQLSNNGVTMEIACFYASGASTGLYVYALDTVQNNNGGFTLNASTHVVTISNTGFYEAIAVGYFSGTSASPLGIFFNFSGTVTHYGAGSTGGVPSAIMNIPAGSTGPMVTHEMFKCSAGATISCYTGGVTVLPTVPAGAYLILRRIG